MDLQSLEASFAGMSQNPNSFGAMLDASLSNYELDVASGIETFGKATGIESIADFGAEMYLATLPEAVSYGQPDISSYEDIESLGDLAKYIQYAITQTVPSMAVGLTAGAAGTVIGGLVGGPAGMVAGGLIGSFLPSVVANTGSVAEEIKEKGGAENSELASIAAGSFMALLDVASLGYVLKPIAGPLMREVGVEAFQKELVRLGVKEDVAKGAIQGFLAEGLTEGTQEYVQGTVAGMATGKEISGDELTERVLNAVLIGGITGSGAGSFSGAAHHILQQKEFQRLQELEGKIELAKYQVFNQAMDEQYDGTPFGAINAGIEVTSPMLSARMMLLDATKDTLVKAQRVTEKDLQGPGFGRLLMDATLGKAGTLLNRMAKVSPGAGRELKEDFLYDESNRFALSKGSRFDITEEAELMTLQWTFRLHSLLSATHGDEKQLGLMVAALRDTPVRMGLERANPELYEAVEGVRNLLNEIKFKGKTEAKLNTGFVVDYFPRFFNSDRFRKNPQLVEQLINLGLQYGYNRVAMEEAAAKIMKGKGIIYAEDLLPNQRVTIEDVAAGKIGKFVGHRVARQDQISRARSLDESRVLAKIPDSELSKLGMLVENPVDVLSEYVRAAAKRITYAKRFGKNEEKLAAKILSAAQDMRAAGAPMTRNELDRIYMLADAFNNNYKPVVHPSYQTANNTLIMYQYIRLLPLATLSSLSEPLVVFERSGTDTRKGIARALLNASKVAIKGWDKALKDMPHNEALQWMVEAGIALDHAATERIAATYGGNAEAVKGTIKIPFTDKEVKTDVITGKFFKYNLLGPFTRFNRMFAFQSALNMVKSHAERLATEQAPVGSRRYVRWVQELKELGLNPIEAVQWYQRGASRADPYAPQVTLAAMRFTNEVVMHPRPNNRPFWQSNPHFALISQLKGFQTVFGNTVVKRWIKKIFGSDIYSGMRNGYQIAGVAILMTSIAMLANMIRERAVWYPEEGNPSWKNSSAEEVLYRAASRAGIFGGAQFALDMLNAHTFGASPLDPVLGPTVSQGVELFEGLASATIGDSSKKLQTEVMKAFPFMTNISPGLRQAMKEEIEQIRL